MLQKVGVYIQCRVKCLLQRCSVAVLNAICNLEYGVGRKRGGFMPLHSFQKCQQLT
jgi:hypothetical protein